MAVRVTRRSFHDHFFLSRMTLLANTASESPRPQLNPIRRMMKMAAFSWFGTHSRPYAISLSRLDEDSSDREKYSLQDISGLKMLTGCQGEGW